ncbi:MAG TPA: ferritin-like domain-containing protein [Polyangiales bacterium]|nr:ferritin-like domain-containing protein [Polyangiales bacterium]
MPVRSHEGLDAARPSIAARDYPGLLRGVFRHAVGCALASGLAAAACQTSGTELDREQGSSPGRASAGSERGRTAGTVAEPSPHAPGTPACERGSVAWLVGLVPAERFDAAELRSRYARETEAYVRASEGVLCGTASDQERCRAHIVEAERTLEFAESCGMIGACATYLITTQRDVVRKYESQAEFMKLLGPIDSPADAFLLLSQSQFSVQCADPTRELEAGGPEGSTIRAVDDGFEGSVIRMMSACPYQFARVLVRVARNGQITERERELLPTTGMCEGRRPEGLLSQHRAGSRSRLGEHFARMAHMEAASVDAFEVIAAELAQHRAPRALVAWAKRAAADEVRHAELTAALARRFGGQPSKPLVAPRPLRTLEALALDNAIEGCVRECFGAAVGCYQAQTAADPEIAAAMAVIAEDETRHAALAFELAAWIHDRLDAGARARVDAARARAVARLRAELACAADGAERAALGFPDAAAALRLHDALARSLWS